MRPDTASVEDAYPAWIQQHDRLDEYRRRQILARIAGFGSPPLISVIMPVFNPDPAHLSAAIQSVEQQLYPHWQLCIADDASTDPAVAATLRQAAARDRRITVLWRERNGHISAASNSALSCATGTFVALLDHDDLLSPRALYEVAVRIVDQPGADIIYSDEDHIDSFGRRSRPYFKPGWNPDLIAGHNLISHLGVYRRALVERIGGFRIGFEGSQDYDLALRAVAETRPDGIVHIPEVLYHWRQDAADRTFSQASHDRCVRNGRRAVQQFVARHSAGATAMPAPALPIFTRVVYPVPAAAPIVSILVAADDDANAVERCLAVLAERTDYPNLEVLVHGRRVASVRGDMKRANAAAQAANGSLLLLLDSAIEATDSGWLREMVSHALRPEIGAVGAKLINPDGTVRHAGITVSGSGIAHYQFPGRLRSDPGYFGHLQLVRNVTAVSGACLMVRRETFLHAGGLEDDSPLAPFSDVDLCLKLIERGYRNVWTPYAELAWHHRPESSVTEPDRMHRAAVAMRRRWGHRLDTDAYWNPNLSTDRARLSLVSRRNPERSEVLKPRSALAPASY
nr:glycosyltransferase [uncultured Rhodopila sp.]